MKKFGLIGNPITHSKSPALFTAAYSAFPFSYSLIEADTIEKAMARFLSEGFTGINVTAPFKDSVFNYITHPDRVSSLLGSANIILRKGEQGEELHSYNSDYYGVKNTIEALIQPSGKVPQLIKQALVIGAGGAGKAAALAFKDMGIKVFLANRSADKTMEFINKINGTQKENPVQYISLGEIPQYLKKCELIVYSLSIKIAEVENINLSGKIIFEANYAHPIFAQKNGETENYVYISGKHWLYNQAIPAFQLFTEVDPNTEAMKKIICL